MQLDSRSQILPVHQGQIDRVCSVPAVIERTSGRLAVRVGGADLTSTVGRFNRQFNQSFKKSVRLIVEELENTQKID